MAYILAMISGKGGSGKTTLALGLSRMLSECGVKVLLIDFDLATNGATYFFESKYEGHIQTTRRMLRGEWERALKISDNFWFVPTDTRFPAEDDGKEGRLDNITTFLISVRNQFDVIICDCQAGYSELLKYILEQADINLAVMEPDTISTASLRVLYARMYSLMESRNTFQVFNKITAEEVRLYEPVTSATLFPLLPAVAFNWEVRKVFSLSEIPSWRTTNAEFGKNICQLGRTLFRKHEDAINRYEHEILEYEQGLLDRQLKRADYKLSSSRKYHLILRWTEILMGVLGALMGALLASWQMKIEALETVQLLAVALLLGLATFFLFERSFRRAEKQGTVTSEEEMEVKLKRAELKMQLAEVREKLHGNKTE